MDKSIKVPATTIKKKTDWRKVGMIIFLLAPTIISLCVFWAGNQAYTLKLAFTNPNTNEFTLFGNFRFVTNALFSDGGDPYLHEGLRNTFLYFVLGIAMIPLSLFVSFLIHKKMMLSGLMRVCLYLPGAIGGIIMSVLYTQLMASDGPIFAFLVEKGLWGDSSFLTEHGLAYCMIYDAWLGVAGNMLIWLGSLSRIPVEIEESAQLDGITTFKEFLYIAIPLIWPTMVTMISLQVVNFFGATGSILLLTDGQYGTYTLSFWLYKTVLSGQTDKYNYNAATGLFMTVLTIPLLIFSRKVLNRFGEEVEY